MKILAIDDQQLILLSVEKKLTDLGYQVQTASSGATGIETFNSFKPDLVIVDINMPDMSGLDVVKHIKNNSSTAIMVMSGNTDEDIILDGFNLGIDDYMKKPVSLEEVAARVKRIVGAPTEAKTATKVDGAQMLQKNCVGVVIPCYNEADRLSSAEFKDFAQKNLGYHLCFVNDGSTDNTLEVLEELRKESENTISVYNCKKNGGKAEAVRQGVLHLAKDSQFDYIGYLDADLSTDFRDFDELVKTIENSEYKIVSGSRISRMGADITKESARKIISKTINLIIQNILKMPFKDTQCGAKIMDREIATTMFNKKFITRWLFDVEIFMRMKKKYGKDNVQQLICEQPLKRWIHADGSKLSMKDSIKIVGQLAQIKMHYGNKSYEV
ncbi:MULTISPECIES: response regulator [Cellulophaga]|uniref:dolichyl-phosphate beta-glucosyltransferase n=2 Tax=Cellulophaga TaxID=104264 RepID=F0RG89_CELLC|nr:MULTISPECIES: response regulator [Cellulophaga]ADY29055.1 response regulator receiver protein [Cellulophaga lytica DSM 7489]AIM60097.1 transcriptional regulator [Cellulophaga lytica]EWH13191.1 response regulator receiver protein [Cellulophaga geojensis KL-A]MDO6854154.1 response regulator [Cellulophaga lytica]WQG76773.1 response regulator [Cellulophaga lytica]